MGVCVKIDDSKNIGWIKFFRFKVFMDFRELFFYEVLFEIENGKEIGVDVRYKRLSDICYFYGKLGYIEKDCLVRELEE